MHRITNPILDVVVTGRPGRRLGVGGDLGPCGARWPAGCIGRDEAGVAVSLFFSRAEIELAREGRCEDAACIHPSYPIHPFLLETTE
jgi:hypothetical protein